jgi:hypothetical protein
MDQVHHSADRHLGGFPFLDLHGRSRPTRRLRATIPNRRRPRRSHDPGRAQRRERFTRRLSREEAPAFPHPVQTRDTELFAISSYGKRWRRGGRSLRYEKAGQEIQEGRARAEGDVDSDRPQEAREGSYRKEAIGQDAAEFNLASIHEQSGVYSRHCEPKMTGPATSRKDGTHAVFQVSKVDPHSKHSKLAICRDGAIASTRLYIAPHLQDP